MNFLHHSDHDDIKQHASLLQQATEGGSNTDKAAENGEAKHPHGTFRSLKASVGKLFHHNRMQSTQSLPPNGNLSRRMTANTDTDTITSDGSTSSTDDEDEDIRPATPLVDPSTNVDPLSEPLSDDEGIPRTSKEGDAAKKKKRRTKDVSKHTFYIENSQMRLKLYARNAVTTIFHLSGKID